MDYPVLFPTPRQCTFSGGAAAVARSFQLHADPLLISACHDIGFSVEAEIQSILCQGTDSGVTPVHLQPLDGINGAFCLHTDAKGIVLNCSGTEGVYYALSALRRLVCGSQLFVCDLKDAPALEVRGIMLDIGRDKIPSMQTLFDLLDWFSQMRINHVQLYMEGFCFDYPQYRYLFSDETPITAAEFRTLSNYAKARCIDLVPNLNVLGHMEKWLERPQFRHLAECEDGYIFNNLYWRPPMTLDVNDPDSFALARELLDTLLENSDSEWVNLNLDEPFELGMGKNAQQAQKDGRLSLYFSYAEKLAAYCRKKGRKMMMWGDEVLSDPDNASRMPEGVTLLDWIYEGDAHFEDHARAMQKAGLRFCLCPGTSSWGALTGRNDNMRRNIADAAVCAARYGGAGIITTDWGDLGHWQYISSSYPAFAYTAECAWTGSAGNDDAVRRWCSETVYHASDDSAWRAAWDLGNYYHCEHTPLYNTTLCFAVMSSKYTFESFEEFDEKMQRLLTLSANIAATNHIPPQKPIIGISYAELDDFLARVELEIDQADLHGKHADLIRAEMRNGLAMIRHGEHLYRTMTEYRGTPCFTSEMNILTTELNQILHTHYDLWCARNRTGGFARSTAHMQKLLWFYRKMIAETK